MIRMEKQSLYIGIDFDESGIRIGYYRPGMKDIETIGPILPEACGQDVAALFCEKTNAGQHSPSLSWEENDAKQSAGTLLKKLLALIPDYSAQQEIASLSIRLSNLSMEGISRVKRDAASLSFPMERLHFLDDRDAFCRFAMQQKRELTLHDMVLFFCRQNELSCITLTKTTKSVPQELKVEKKKLGTLDPDEVTRDRQFAEFAQKELNGRLVSTVYLSGDGMEGNWLSISLSVLCKGRNVFRGSDIYARGACQDAIMRTHKEKPSYIFFHEYKLKKNLLLKVRNQNQFVFAELAEAGINCYEAQRSIEVLLSDDSSVDLWVRDPRTNQARVETLELTGLTKRGDRRTRLEIALLPLTTSKCMVRITDLGDVMEPASGGQIWEYEINE